MLAIGATPYLMVAIGLATLSERSRRLCYRHGDVIPSSHLVEMMRRIR